MNPDWNPIEQHDAAFIVAALDELSTQLDAAEQVTSWPKPGEAPSDVDHLNEATKREQIEDVRTRLSRVRELLTSFPLARRVTETMPPEFTAHSVPVADEVVGTALGRYQSNWADEPTETVVTPELF